jgi:hypothetical protein
VLHATKYATLQTNLKGAASAHYPLINVTNHNGLAVAGGGGGTLPNVNYCNPSPLAQNGVPLSVRESVCTSKVDFQENVEELQALYESQISMLKS